MRAMVATTHRGAGLFCLTALLCLFLTACSDSDTSRDPLSTPDPVTPTDPVDPMDPVDPVDPADPETPEPPPAFLIKPGPNATLEAVSAMVGARPGDTIEFDCGFFEIDQSLLLSNTENITIKGCGINDTVLSFKNSPGIEGFLIDNVRGIVIQDLTAADTDGNAFELRSVDHGTLSRVHAYWSSGGGAEAPVTISADNYQDGRLQIACTDPPFENPDAPGNEAGDISSPDYTPSDKAGRYGIYPVKSSNILVENSVATGASDAGIYVGQTDNAIIRDSRAVYNVFGFEIENVQGGEYSGNLAECNTGGFLVYDLDGITQYGDKTRVFNNISRNNNTYNFTEGGIVSQIPPGTGMLTLSYDRIDVFDNLFENNNTGGFIHVSYELLPEGAGRPDTDFKIDFYSEGVHLYRNTFRNNGNGLPAPNSNDIAEQKVAAFLPAVIGQKVQAACGNATNAGKCPVDENGTYRSAHIVWDGLLEEYDPDCPYPVDANGDPLPQNDLGKPLYTNEHPQPTCRYNAYKFDLSDPETPRLKPQWFASCIDDTNVYSDDSIQFANFRGLKGAGAAIAVALGQTPTAQQIQETSEFPAILDDIEHQCVSQYGSNLPPLEPITIPEFVPSELAVEPTAEEIAELCEATVGATEVNFGAAPVNCPDLAQYNLFSNPQDPTSMPNGQGFPFVLNTKLFSDYSVKYRVAYLPPGTQATYQDGGATAANAAIAFPTGTIIAKTFSFLDGNTETAIETRLIIKRDGLSEGQSRWEGLPYVWETATDGTRSAKLQRVGAVRQVSWDYTDPSSGVSHVGSTDNYNVPNANQCLSCHTNQDVEGGSAPIGPKIRNLNRPYQSESTITTGQSTHPIAGKNQIAWMCGNGLMTGCPDDLGVNPSTLYAEALPRTPKFNIPGDGDAAAGTDADIEQRARAWLEVNCQHCHNNKGFAANTGFYLDVFREVDINYGICKNPTATGSEGSGGRAVDIHPGDASKSILEFRISELATSASARMPPVARSVVDVEGHALIRDWINNVVDSTYKDAGCESN